MDASIYETFYGEIWQKMNPSITDFQFLLPSLYKTLFKASSKWLLLLID